MWYEDQLWPILVLVVYPTHLVVSAGLNISGLCWLKKKVLCCEEIQVRTVRWEWCLEEKIS